MLDAEVNKVNDPKRSFAFSLKCRGVEEMFFAGEDDDLSGIWMARLSNASRNHGKLSMSCLVLCVPYLHTYTVYSVSAITTP